MSRKLMFVVNSESFFISHRLPIALEAIRQGFEVHIATSLDACVNNVESMGLIVHPLNLNRRSASIFSNSRTFIQILRIFLKVRPDVVHLVTIKPVLLGGVAARFAAVPCVVAAISGLGFVFSSHGIKAAIRRCLAGCFYRLALGHKNLKVIFQNENDQACLVNLSHLSRENVSLIRGSGVDLSHYSPAPFQRSGLPVVVLAARLLADKGVREFVDAARILKNGGIAARFVLVGEPDFGNPATISDIELKQWVTEGLIEWWGHRSDIPKVFSSSHIVVLPSYYGEGLPKVLLEAAACGRPVITTDHPGCRDAVVPNLTGILVPIRDSKALSKAIGRLVNNSLLREDMGSEGRKLAEGSFDVQLVIAKHMRIYDELLQRVN